MKKYVETDTGVFIFLGIPLALDGARIFPQTPAMSLVQGSPTSSKGIPPCTTASLEVQS